MRILANGYQVIAEKPSRYKFSSGETDGTIVLAMNETMDQYATWWKDQRGNTYAGDYFPIFAFSGPQEQFEAASKAYLERTGL